MQKIKIWLGDHWRLLFHSAADNHARIERCHEKTDGSLRCDINFASYLELKKYQKKFRRLTVSLASAIAMVLVALVVSPYIFNPSGSQAGSYTWMQTAWNDGANTDAAIKNGETNYASKDQNIDTTTVPGDAKLVKAADKTETDDAHFSATGTYGSNTDVFTLAGTLKPKRTNAALCGNTTNHDGECTSGNCDTNFVNANKYCHATASSCVDFTTGLTERADGYELCSANAWFKSCANSLWGSQVNNPNAVSSLYNAGGGTGSGYWLAESCTSSLTGGFNDPATTPNKHSCTPYLAASTSACKTSCASAADCWSGATCEAGGICTPPFVCGTDTVSHLGYTYGTVQVGTQCWLDRNLGATAVASAFNTQAAYGWLFQWGRKADGHQYTAWGSQPSPVLSTAVAGPSSTSTVAAPNDVKFLTSAASPYDWLSPQNNTLWATASGSINNPCPTGWHVPLQTEWASVVTAAGITNYTTAASSVLHLPAAGYRFYNGTLTYQGSNGYYWSSSPYSTYAYYLYFDSASVNPANGNIRAGGFSVRCVKN